MRKSTGRSTGRGSIHPADFRRYSVNLTNTAPRPSIAPRVEKCDKDAMANKLFEFFEQYGAQFRYDKQMIKNGPSRKEFAQWLDFMLTHLNGGSRFELNDARLNDEVPAVFSALCYPIQFKPSLMISINAPHSWPNMLMALDWLRTLIMTETPEIPPDNERQDYESKYAVECYKREKSGDSDFSEIRLAFHQLIVTDSMALNNIDELIQTSTTQNEELDIATNVEKEAVEATEREIVDIAKHINEYKTTSSQLQSSVQSLSGQKTTLEGEIGQMKERMQRLREEEYSLKRQVEQQPVTAEDAQQMLKSRDLLRAESKELKEKASKLQATISTMSAELSKLATEKNEKYRQFCNQLERSAAYCPEQMTAFRRAIFGDNHRNDSLRASCLGSEATEAFRQLLKAMHEETEKQLRNADVETLVSRLNQINNEIQMLEQRAQQKKESHDAQLRSHEMKFAEMHNTVAAAEKECVEAQRDLDEIVEECSRLQEVCDRSNDELKSFSARLEDLEAEEEALFFSAVEYSENYCRHKRALEGPIVEVKAQIDDMKSVTECVLKRNEAMKSRIETVEAEMNEKRTQLKSACDRPISEYIEEAKENFPQYA